MRSAISALSPLLPLLVAACAATPPAENAPPPLRPVTTATSTAVAAVDAGASPARDEADDVAIDKAQAEYLDLLVKVSPEAATGLGIHTRDTELEERESRAWDRLIEEEERFLKGLEERFKAPRASKRAQIDLQLMQHQLRVDIRRKRVERPLERSPAIYVTPLNAIFLMTARAYAPEVERARNVLARLERIPAVVGEARKNLLNPPKVWTQIGIERSGGAKAFFDEQRPFLLKALPEEKARVEAALKGATKAYEEFKVYLQKEVMPRSNGSFAAGRDHFDFLLHEDYFLDEDADGVLAIGKRVLAETDAKMAETARRIDPKAKGWDEVLKKAKGNHPTAEGLLPAYRLEVERARNFLKEKDIVEFPEGDDLSVIDTPVFQRSTVTAAYDQPPPFDKVTKGFFFVTPVDKTLSKAKQEEMLRENDHGDIVDTAVHEAYPGHHLQLSFARRHPSTARKVTDAAIFSEGWALYAEELMAELGYYTDEERLLQLEWALVRAARILIDVGLHTQNMTFDEAVKILTDRVHLERELALSEVKRYTTNPTQPLAYLTGREMIFKLRERYKAREGERFTLKRFHTEILSHGTIAPGLIAKEMF